MLRSVNEESAEETRKEQIVQSAISTLSFSELEAIIHIFDELNGMEGILVASKIADRVGITRSVIVNALRKFESAGVIESRSSGTVSYTHLIFDAAAGVGGKPGFFVRVKGGNCFDKADGSDGQKIFCIVLQMLIFFYDMSDQTEIVLDQNMTGLIVTVCTCLLYTSRCL